jgi:hypothetical protein
MSTTFDNLIDSINLTIKLAKDNFDARKAIIDRLNSTAVSPLARANYIAGECNHFFPRYDQNYNKYDEVVLSCVCSPTVKGGIRYSFKINGKVTAKDKILQRMLDLGL